MRPEKDGKVGGPHGKVGGPPPPPSFPCLVEGTADNLEPRPRGLFKALSGLGLEKEMATHSSILAWRTPWTEETGRLQSTDLTEGLHFHFWALEVPILLKLLFHPNR